MEAGDSTLACYVEAEYEDGYVHREDAQDHSPYVSGKNIFSDILEGRPEEAHGRCVRFSLVTATGTYNVDWTVLPDNARPIRWKHMECDYVNGEAGPARIMRVDFGYQYTNDEGHNVQEVIELT